MYSWYAIHTKLHQEVLAESNIRRFGIETFYPRIKKEKVIRGKRRDVIASLFPRYIFAYFDLATHYRMVHYASGVDKIVSFGNQPPSPVDDKVIQAIKDRIDNGYVSLVPADLAVGDIVEIKDGPFEGLSAIFEGRWSDKDRVVLLLNILSQKSRVVIDRQKIEKVK